MRVIVLSDNRNAAISSTEGARAKKSAISSTEGARRRCLAHHCPPPVSVSRPLHYIAADFRLKQGITPIVGNAAELGGRITWLYPKKSIHSYFSLLALGVLLAYARSPGPEAVEPAAEVTQEIIERAAIDVMRIDQDVALAPLQTAAVARGDIGVAAHHEQGDDRDRRRPELVCECRGRFVVIQRPEPIDDLVEAATETRRPVGAVPLARSKQAARRRVFELNEAVRLFGAVARDHIGDKLSIEPHLDAETITGSGSGVVRGEEGGEMGMRAKEGEDVVTLLQRLFRAQQDIKRVEVHLTRCPVEAPWGDGARRRTSQRHARSCGARPGERCPQSRQRRQAPRGQ